MPVRNIEMEKLSGVTGSVVFVNPPAELLISGQGRTFPGNEVLSGSSHPSKQVSSGALTWMTFSSVDLHSTDSEISVTALFSSTETTLMGRDTVFPVSMAVFRISVSWRRKQTYLGQGSKSVLWNTTGNLPKCLPGGPCPEPDGLALPLGKERPFLGIIFQEHLTI